jgi:hypothetical protein
MGKLYLGTQAITPFVYDNQGGGGADIGIPREISQSGVYQMPSSSFTYTLPAGATSLGDNALDSAFRGSQAITSADLSNVTSVGKYGMYAAFRDCQNLTSVDLSDVENVGEYGFSYTFYGCSSLISMSFNSLSNIDARSAFSSAFYNCTNLTSVSFPALTASSFGTTYKNQFSGMLGGCSNVILHFPSRLASTTISNLTGYPNFGGTHITILGDL